MKKALLTAAAALAMVTVTPAHAETVPGCVSAKQIGSKALVAFGDQTAASVKQFAGCGKNWGYIWVWADWAARHPDFHPSVSVITDDGKAHGKVMGRLNQRELWSDATDTVNECTRAQGRVALGEDGWSANSSRRC